MTTAPIITKLSIPQVEQARRDGFTAIPRLLDQTTLETLRDYYDKILRGDITLGAQDRQLGGITRQVVHPHKHIEYFRDNPGIRIGKVLAGQILGVAAVELYYDMLIYKPPGHPKPTPWHQDYSYSAMPVQTEGAPMQQNNLQFWVALDDVDVENGCMHFVPGQHRGGLAKHFVYSGSPEDPGRLLATAAFGDPDLPNAGIACPLAAGGCTIHFFGTPHYTPPNRSATRGRRAYIFNLIAKEQPNP